MHHWECGLPARKRPRWPLSQEAGGSGITRPRRGWEGGDLRGTQEGMGRDASDRARTKKRGTGRNSCRLVAEPG